VLIKGTVAKPAVALLNRHIDNPMTMDELAKASGYSRRQRERLFIEAVGNPPSEFYRGIWLERGRNLLRTTDLKRFDFNLKHRLSPNALKSMISGSDR
jgi:transcriptional regulator GlxA family with amidase domain